MSDYLLGIFPGPVEAGRADSEIAGYLGVPPQTPILLSEYTERKAHYKHKEIGFEQYKKLPFVIANGFVARSSRRGAIEICYVEMASEIAAFACLKATAAKEIFLATYLPHHMTEARRIYRRAVKRNALLRDAPEPLVRAYLQGMEEKRV